MALLAAVLLTLPALASAFTAAPYSALPSNCGQQALVSPIPPGCLGAGGSLPSGWSCPVQPSNANGAEAACAKPAASRLSPQCARMKMFPRQRHRCNPL
jgi:hypothetical protein